MLARPRAAAGLIALVLLGAGTAWYVLSDSAEPGAITDIRSVSQLRDEFNKAAGSVRIIVLLSPT